MRTFDWSTGLWLWSPLQPGDKQTKAAPVAPEPSELESVMARLDAIDGVLSDIQTVLRRIDVVLSDAGRRT